MATNSLRPESVHHLDAPAAVAAQHAGRERDLGSAYHRTDARGPSAPVGPSRRRDPRVPARTGLPLRGSVLRPDPALLQPAVRPLRTGAAADPRRLAVRRPWTRRTG